MAIHFEYEISNGLGTDGCHHFVRTQTTIAVALISEMSASTIDQEKE